MAGEESTVQIKVSIATQKLLEKAKEKLANMEIDGKKPFDFVRLLPDGGFLNVLFGLSPLSEYCREVFFGVINDAAKETLSEISPATEEEKITPEPETEEPVEIIETITERQQKIVNVLKEQGPLKKNQIIHKIGLKPTEVEPHIRVLSMKRIILWDSHASLWKLNPEMAGKFALKGPTVKERIVTLLKTSAKPMLARDITKEVKANRKTINKYLKDLHEEGRIEKIPVKPGLTAWKSKDNETITAPEPEKEKLVEKIGVSETQQKIIHFMKEKGAGKSVDMRDISKGVDLPLAEIMGDLVLLLEQKIVIREPGEFKWKLNPEIPITSGTIAPKTEREKPVEILGTISKRQKKLIDALKEKGIPLTKKQIANVTGLKVKEVEWDMTALSRKGIISQIPNSYEWELNPDMAAKFVLREPTIQEKIVKLLETTTKPMSTPEIATGIDVEPRSAGEALRILEGKGVVEKIPIRHNLMSWRLKPETTP